ncbi:MAG: restriction endonuclease, SacI family, partial [Arachnia sp.]
PSTSTTRGARFTTNHQEPNNQPFFRYLHMEEIDRVLNRDEFNQFLVDLRGIEMLDEDDALAALAAFLKVAFEEAASLEDLVLAPGDLSVEALLGVISGYVSDRFADERPKRLQAFGAACLDLGHFDVRSRRINDPSRDVPGDVQAYLDDVPFLSMEVRGKGVPATELDSFIYSCMDAGIARVMLFVDWHQHHPLVLPDLQSTSLLEELFFLSVYESASQLAVEALTWADLPVLDATQVLAERMLSRLKEIEISREGLDEWVAAVEAVVK